MKHSILILDDSDERHRLFAKYIGNTFDSLYTAERLLSAIQLKELVADTLFLDHDLGTGMDGTAFVNALQAEKLEMPSVKRIFVHSNNVGKNTNMALTLNALYPDKIVKLAPVTWIGDVWNDLERDAKRVREYFCNLGE